MVCVCVIITCQKVENRLGGKEKVPWGESHISGRTASVRLGRVIVMLQIRCRAMNYTRACTYAVLLTIQNAMPVRLYWWT